MKKITCILAALLGLAGQAHATLIEFAVSEESRQRADIFPTMAEAMMTARKGDAITLHDVKSATRLATIVITEDIANATTPAARTNWLQKTYGPQLAKVKRYLTDTTAGQGSGDPVRWIRSLELRRTEFPGQRVQAVCFCSPIVTTPAAYSMVNRYPADAFLLTPDSIFESKGRALDGITVHIIHSNSLNEFSALDAQTHREKLKRFYALFVAGQGAQLATFHGSAEHLKKVATADFQKIDYGRPERGDGKLSIYEILSPALEKKLSSSQAQLWAAPIVKNAPASLPAAAPLDVGIRWAQPGIDLDLYVMAEGDTELFYRQQSAPKYAGRHLKDVTSGGTAESFETVSYESAVPLGRLRVYVNHYSGSIDIPLDVELRVRVNGGVYSKKFRVQPGRGTGGTGSRDANTPAWVRLDVAEVLRL